MCNHNWLNYGAQGFNGFTAQRNRWPFYTLHLHCCLGEKEEIISIKQNISTNLCPKDVFDDVKLQWVASDVTATDTLSFSQTIICFYPKYLTVCSVNLIKDTVVIVHASTLAGLKLQFILTSPWIHTYACYFNNKTTERDSKISECVSIM